MQLLLDFDSRHSRLMDVHRRLTHRFGPLPPLILLDPVSQLVLALIGTRTSSEVSKAAFEQLIVDFGSWNAVRDASVADIRSAIGAVSFADAKAAHLKRTLVSITRRNGSLDLEDLAAMTVDDALVWLECLPGVGRKVSAATLNFSTLRMKALVIDTHGLRLYRRLRLVPDRADYRRAYEEIMPLVPAHWDAADLDHHNQLLKRLGQTLCRAALPICRRCPLRDMCPTARSSHRLRQSTRRSDNSMDFDRTRPKAIRTGRATWANPATDRRMLD